MKKILTILLGLSSYSPIFAQTKSADSLYYEQSLIKDSIQVDGFVKIITGSSVYSVTEKIKNGTSTYLADEKRIITVYVYKDSVSFTYTPVPVNFNPYSPQFTNTFYKGTFIRRSTHWYYYCSVKDIAWALKGMQFISDEIIALNQQK